MMTTGFRFQIRRIPFRVSIWFLVTLLLINIGRLQPLFRSPVTSLYFFIEGMLIAGLAVVVHELGHCWAYRHYDQEPSVLLWGFGGLTFGQAKLPPKRSIVVSVAGPLAGIVLMGLPVVVLANTVLANWFPSDTVGIMAYQTLNDIKWFAIIWSLINLLPIIPLDGGHICEAVLELVHGEERKQTARLISVVTGVAFAVVTFFILGMVWGLFLGGFLALHNFLAYRHENDPSAPRIDLVPESDLESGGYEANVVSMQSARKKRDRRSPAELVRAGYDQLQHRDYSGALRTAARLQDKRLNSELASEAAQLSAWAWLGQRNPVKAEEALAGLPKGATPTVPLTAVLSLATKQTDKAVVLMVQTMIRQPDSAAKLIAVDLFAEQGMIHRLARELVDQPGGSGFEAAVALEGLLHQLNRTQDASTVSDVILLG